MNGFYGGEDSNTEIPLSLELLHFNLENTEDDGETIISWRNSIVVPITFVSVKHFLLKVVVFNLKEIILTCSRR